MPECPLFEIEAISLRVEPGDLTIVVPSATGARPISDFSHQLCGDDIERWPADLRLEAGLFVSTGAPAAVPGVTTRDVARRLVGKRQTLEADAMERLTNFERIAGAWTESLAISPSLLDRPLETTHSPAEGLALELFQLALAEPDIAVIDLTERRLDSEARAVLLHGLSVVREVLPLLAVLIATTDTDLITDLSPSRLVRLDDDVAVSDLAPSAPALLG